MDQNGPPNSVEPLHDALTALTRSLESWAALLDEGKVFEHKGLKQSWDDLFARTRAVEQLAGDLDRGQKAVERDLRLLVADVGHLNGAWASGIAHLGTLLPGSTIEAALGECVARAEALSNAASGSVPLHAQWSDALARMTGLIEQAAVALKTPQASVELELNEWKERVSREKAQSAADAQASAEKLASALADGARVGDDLAKARHRVAELEGQFAALSKRTLEDAQAGASVSAKAAAAERAMKDASAKAERAVKDAEAKAQRAAKEAEAGAQMKHQELEAALTEKDKTASGLQAQLSAAQDELARANAKISKLTQQVEAAFRKP